MRFHTPTGPKGSNKISGFPSRRETIKPQCKFLRKPHSKVFKFYCGEFTRSRLNFSIEDEVFEGQWNSRSNFRQKKKLEHLNVQAIGSPPNLVVSNLVVCNFLARKRFCIVLFFFFGGGGFVSFRGSLWICVCVHLRVSASDRV